MIKVMFLEGGKATALNNVNRLTKKMILKRREEEIENGDEINNMKYLGYKWNLTCTISGVIV